MGYDDSEDGLIDASQFADEETVLEGESGASGAEIADRQDVPQPDEVRIYDEYGPSLPSM